MEEQLHIHLLCGMGHCYYHTMLAFYYYELMVIDRMVMQQPMLANGKT